MERHATKPPPYLLLPYRPVENAQFALSLIAEGDVSGNLLIIEPGIIRLRETT